MLFEEFVKRFRPVLDTFGEKKFPIPVLTRMHLKAEELDAGEMATLVDLILDNCEHSPRVTKVAELVNVVKARRSFSFRKNSNDESIPIDCSFCMDTGAVPVRSIHDHITTLMRCECRAGQQQREALPSWSRAWSQLYQRFAPSLGWFKPEVLETHKDGSIKIENINRKRDYWTAKLQIAEQYWKQVREDAGASS